MRSGRAILSSAALAVAGATALAACGSSGGSTAIKSSSLGQYGTVPPAAAGTEHAGTISVAAPPSSAPTWVLPLVTAATNSVTDTYAFDYQLYRPLYWYENGYEPKQTPSMSLANLPVWSNSDKTATITLKSSYKWSDGTPVSAKDVVMWYDLMAAAVKQSPANWAGYSPGLGMPDQVASVTATGPSTVVFQLKTSVNPAWFTENELASIQPMPAQDWAKTSAGGKVTTVTAANAGAIYKYLSGQSGSLSAYATNPLWQTVDGPYKLVSFNSTSGAFLMKPNTSYGGPHARVVSSYQSVPYTSDTAELNAVRAGGVDVGYIPLTNVPEAGAIKKSGYRVFGYPEFGFTSVEYNFKDTTGDFDHIIGQLYIRQALAHLENEPGIIKSFVNNAAGPGYGPVPVLPRSPYTPANATANPYPYSISDAVGLLRAHGWKIVPGGTDTCTRPGTGSPDCGAGIPAGTKLAWNLYYGSDPAIHQQQDTALASQAKRAGIEITLASSNFDYMINNYNDQSPAGLHNLGKWAMEEFGGLTDSTYPTTEGAFNTGGSSNIGGYSSPQADALIKASLTSSNPNAVRDEAAFLTKEQPNLFEPNVDAVLGTAGLLAWKSTVSGPPAYFQTMTQALVNPEFLYFTK